LTGRQPARGYAVRKGAGNDILAPGCDSALAELPINRLRGQVCFNQNAPSSRTNSDLRDIAARLCVDSFLSVPLSVPEQHIGRLYVGWSRGCNGDRKMSEFSRMATYASEMVKSLLGIDGLLDEVAVGERRRVSRDLHDSTIQPYIGLKLGLEALRRKLTDRDRVSREVDELIRMAEDSIADLRSYVGGLGEAAKRRPRTQVLLPALQQMAKRFSELHGIETHVIAHGEIVVSAAIFDQAMHITREALSNIRRHTAARQAAIRVACRSDQLILEFVNHNADHRLSRATFYPRSIGERATELGGQLHVQQIQSYTTVVVQIPAGVT
jgi:signal transduction histidine kinase